MKSPGRARTTGSIVGENILSNASGDGNVAGVIGGGGAGGFAECLPAIPPRHNRPWTGAGLRLGEEQVRVGDVDRCSRAGEAAFNRLCDQKCSPPAVLRIERPRCRSPEVAACAGLEVVLKCTLKIYPELSVDF